MGRFARFLRWAASMRARTGMAQSRCRVQPLRRNALRAHSSVWAPAGARPGNARRLPNWWGPKRPSHALRFCAFSA